mmetsp:Transcript_14523/g.18967  ORF Transcript_14523/g.18967 Transcript_14523/m.18967 type:complete len:471 (+) Transcript_14523:103-1515(+)
MNTIFRYCCYGVAFTLFLHTAYEIRMLGALEGTHAIETSSVLRKPEASIDMSITTDVFAHWSKRQEVSNATLFGILEQSKKDPCYSSSYNIPEKSLYGIAHAIQKKVGSSVNKKTKIVVGVLGDSVAAEPDGFVPALESYLTLSPFFPFDDVEVRNYAKGGTGAKFTYFCNELRGDEDIVVFENVRPGEQDSVFDLSSSLKSTGFGVILVNWHGPNIWRFPYRPHSYGFRRASTELNIPLIDLSQDYQKMVQCLPQDFNFSQPVEKLIHRDEVHPNYVGRLFIATMIGHVFDKAALLHKDIDWENDNVGFQMGNETSVESPVCFNNLNCTLDEEARNPSCLKVTDKSGFQLRSLPNGKSWWEGTAPGHHIEFVLRAKCAKIVLFINKRPINGMVKVEIDGKVTKSTLPDGNLDFYRDELWWLPKSRGLHKEVVIASNLEREQHTVRLEVQNETHSKDGTFKVDFTSASCV